MTKRSKILLGMGAGVIWAIAVVAVPVWLGLFLPFPANFVLIYASFFPGLVLLAMVGRLAARRFFDDDAIDGDEFLPGSGGDIDVRVLNNTTEQCLLAALIWPMALIQLGGATVLVMALAFAVARLAFWIGYHWSPPLRAFGFAATFYPTVLAGLWSLVTLFS